MKEPIILTGIEWRETIGHTINQEYPLYVHRPHTCNAVRYIPDKDEYIVYPNLTPTP